VISLELAKKLKEAGLQWEPKEGDYYCYPAGEFSGVFIFQKEANDTIINELTQKFLDRRMWLPRLDQLLAEIEKRGYEWSLHKLGTIYGIELCKSGNMFLRYARLADTSKDAAGKALLWILEKEKEEKNGG